MLHRTISTLVLWSVLGTLLYYFRTEAGVWLLAIVSGLAQHEFYRLLEKTGYTPLKRIGTVLGSIIILGSFYLPKYGGIGLEAGGDMLLLALLALSVACLNEGRRNGVLQTIIPTLAGIMLIPYLLQFLVQIVWLPAGHVGSIPADFDETPGLLLTVWVVLVAKCNDVGALLFGLRFGRTKLAPNLSPGKTWEGAFGGLLIGSLAGLGYVWLLGDYLPEAFGLLQSLQLGLPVIALAVVSDLFESDLKRNAGVKDSGGLIPGIGGLLDLLDSLLYSAPAAYFLLKYAILPATVS